MNKISRTIETNVVQYSIIDVVGDELRESQTLIKTYPASYSEEKIRKVIQKENPGMNVILKRITKESGYYQMDLSDFMLHAEKIEK